MKDPKYLGIPNINFSLTAKNDDREEFFKEQRMTRGFDNTELWNFDCTILNFIIPRLEAFIGITPCHTEEEKKELNMILDIFKIKIEEFNLTVEEDEKYDEALNLFIKHFKGLWY
jgi:hypothetical protein